MPIIKLLRLNRTNHILAHFSEEKVILTENLLMFQINLQSGSVAPESNPTINIQFTISQV